MGAGLGGTEDGRLKVGWDAAMTVAVLDFLVGGKDRAGVEGGNLHADGRETKQGGCQEVLKRLDQIK